MKSIKDWHARAASLRGMALRLEDRAAGLQGEALHLKVIADNCSAEAAERDEQKKESHILARLHIREMDGVATLGELAAIDEIERLRDITASALSWLDRWAMHIGQCPADENCTCGLVAIRHELGAAHVQV